MSGSLASSRTPSRSPCTRPRTTRWAACRPPSTPRCCGPTPQHLGVDGGRHAAHRVVRGRVHGDRLGVRLDAKLPDITEFARTYLGVDLRPLQVRQVQHHIVLVGTAAAALTHLVGHRARNHVARRQVLDGGRVPLHEALALAVAQDRPFAPRGLRQQDAKAGQTGGVELEELHVLQGDAPPERQGHAVAGQGVRVGRGLVDLARAAGGQDDRLGAEDVRLTGGQVVRDDAGHPHRLVVGHLGVHQVGGEQQVEGVELVEERDVLLDALLVEGLQDVAFFNEFYALDLLLTSDLVDAEVPDDEPVRVAGIVAHDLATGEAHVFRAKAVILATGGAGKIYKTTSNAHTLTGDGMALAFRRGIPLEDMEFFQFHPTGLAGLGILLSEAARGEGAILRNSEGERFMERYAPTIKDLAPRDMVARAMANEVREGRGCGPNKDYVVLDLTHLERAQIDAQVPDITEFARTYLGVEPYTEPVPVYPTAHYAMGGVPTTIDAEVLRTNAAVVGTPPIA